MDVGADGGFANPPPEDGGDGAVGAGVTGVEGGFEETRADPGFSEYVVVDGVCGIEVEEEIVEEGPNAD